MKSQPHPLHALACCAAIAFERLAWYALLAALVSWLPRLGYTVPQAAMTVGYVVMAAYALPLLGAQLADRFLGYRAAALLGTCAFTAGYALLAGERVGLGLALVSAGNGLFKPSLMSLLSGATMAGSPERDRDCGRLYRAINVGSLASGVVGGFLVGGASLRFAALTMLTAASGLLIAANWRVLRAGEWKSEVEALTQTPLAHRSTYRMPWAPVAALLVGATAFWSVYNLSYSALVLWAERFVDREALGWTVPAQWFSSLNPLFVILLGPVASWLDRAPAENGQAQRLGLGWKLIAGMALLCGSFAALALPKSAHPGWLALAYGLLSAAELLVSAAAIAAVTSWAPRGQTARVLSLWFLSIAVGGWVAGKLGGAADLRALFGWCAAAAAGGLLWFAAFRSRFTAQERLVAARAAAQ